MIDWISCLLRARSIRYVVVGGWNTAFGYGSFVALIMTSRWTRMNYMAAMVVSQILAVTNAYLCHKWFTFKTARYNAEEPLRFLTVSGLAFAYNAVGLPFCVEILKWPPIAAQAVLLPGTIAIGYALHSRFSFASHRTPSPSCASSPSES